MAKSIFRAIYTDNQSVGVNICIAVVLGIIIINFPALAAMYVLIMLICCGGS